MPGLRDQTRLQRGDANDTSPAARAELLRLYAKMSAADKFRLERLNERRNVDIALGTTLLRVFVDTPENTILRKLEWFRRGGEVSERQWRDVVATLRSAVSLDSGHFTRWGKVLGVSDLLDRARLEASA